MSGAEKANIQEERKLMGLKPDKIGTALALGLVVILAAGCATPTGTVQTQETQTLRGMPVKITRISVPSVPVHGNVQVAAGSVWATQSSMLGFHKTIRIDAKSYHIAELSRPWTAGFADLLVGEQSLWFSDGMTKVTGSGDLYRVDIETNQVTATIEAVGTPFAIGDGAVWAYNSQTQTVTGVDTENNQVRTQLVTQGSVGTETFAFGAGSIWQFAHKYDVSAWQLSRGAIPPSVVRRIDPHTKKVIAEIPVGPYRPTDRIYFVAGAIWVLGERDESAKSFATRIDVNANLVAATIPLVRTMHRSCVNHAFPRTPVFWNGGIWVSTFCTNKGRMPGVLLKIDLQTNQVTDEIGLSTLERHLSGQPGLAAGEGALWGFDGSSAIRLEF